MAALDTLEQAIARCPYLGIGPTPRSRRAEIVPWAFGNQWGNEDPILSLLLTKLPKVRTFRLHGGVDRLWLETIGQIAADPITVALSHLSLIDLNLDFQMDRGGFRMLATLARVPSLTKLQVKNTYRPKDEHIGDEHIEDEHIEEEHIGALHLQARHLKCSRDFVKQSGYMLENLLVHFSESSELSEGLCINLAIRPT